MFGGDEEQVVMSIIVEVAEYSVTGLALSLGMFTREMGLCLFYKLTILLAIDSVIRCSRGAAVGDRPIRLTTDLGIADVKTHGIKPEGGDDALAPIGDVAPFAALVSRIERATLILAR